MTLLDRFRTQAPQHNPDPAVRLAHVAGLPVDNRPAIASIAREDQDPKVRKAAVQKLLDPVALGALARADADDSVRAAAVAMLRDIALEVFEGISEADSLDAVEALPDSRLVAQIARTSGRDVVALRALSGLTDAHALGGVARHAQSEAARLAALELLRERGDNTEVVGVAMNSEHRDTAVAAVEWIADRADLEQIATRGRNKSAAKRARIRIAEADTRAAAEARAAAMAARQATAAEAAAVSYVETIVTHVTQQDLPVAGPPVTEDAAPAAMSSDEMPAQEMPAQEPPVEPSSAERPDNADPIPEEMRSAAGPALADQPSESIDTPESAVPAPAGAEQPDITEAKARERRDAIGRLRHLAGRIEPLLTRDDVSLKAADRALRDLRAALAALPAPGADLDDVLPRLKEAQTALIPRVQELREATEWRQWANVGIQEQLCTQMEALTSVEDPEAIARKVRELQQQWRAAADVPRAQADVLWRRFKAAHDIVWTRCESHFAAEAETRTANLARKTELCEKVEAMSESTSWIATAEAIKQMQADWKTIGPVSRGREKAIWDRFRSACDRFFTRRHADLAERKKAWAENFARKEALCVRAEVLAESTEWESAASEIRRLQGEFGPVKKSRSEAIWQRFRSACDRFFTRYATRHDTARTERIAAREAICAEVEGLLSGEAGTEPPADLQASLRSLRQRYAQEVASRGVDPERARQIDERFDGAVAAIVARWPAAFAGSEFDPEANRTRMEALVQKVEDLVKSVTRPAAAVQGDSMMSPTVRLAAMLKEALAANTIGGKADDESRWRTAAEEVRQAKAAWARLGFVPDEARRALSQRFNQACSRILAGREAPDTRDRRDRGDRRDGRDVREKRPRQQPSPPSGSTVRE
jgi:hypothetical protein